MLRGITKAEHGCCNAYSGKDGHTVFSRLYFAQVGDTFLQGQIEVWRREKQRTVPVNGGYFQSRRGLVVGFRREVCDVIKFVIGLWLGLSIGFMVGGICRK